MLGVPAALVSLATGRAGRLHPLGHRRWLAGLIDPSMEFLSEKGGYTNLF